MISIKHELYVDKDLHEVYCFNSEKLKFNRDQNYIYAELITVISMPIIISIITI